MNIIAISALDLKRYPEQDSRSTLQAWDAADEYLLATCQALTLTEPKIITINDSFGALSCALQHYAVTHISDSYLSQQATQLNLKRNSVSQQQVAFIDCLEQWPAAPDLVLFKIPKTLALLEFQLYQLSQVVSANTMIIAGAKAQDIHTSTLQLFEHYLGTTKTSLAKKKARLIFCQPDTVTKKPQYQAQLSWPLEKTTYQISNHPSVFSRSSLDIGARFFIQHLPTSLTGKIADLGCGNGVVGLMALVKNPQATLLFTDESYMAVASARINVSQNRPQDLARCQFYIDNCLAQQPDNSLQLVLCNPPFHQQNAITDHIARQMFSDAKRCLVAGGELRVIANRHLGYYPLLKKLFGHCETMVANNKFVILKVIKNR